MSPRVVVLTALPTTPPSAMPLNGNVFNSSWGAESITRYDRRLHTHDAINPGAPYPSAVTIVGRSERSLFQLDTSFNLHISDTLWSFAIACNEDIQARVFANVKNGGRAGHNVLHRLLHIGIHNWRALNMEGNGHHPSLPIHYAGVLGNALLLHIERANDQVRLSCRNCAAVIDYKHRSTPWKG